MMTWSTFGKKLSLFSWIYNGPLNILALQACKQDISKTVWAVVLQLDRLIGDDE